MRRRGWAAWATGAGVVAAGLLAASPAGAQVLWRGASAGMSKAQVQRLFPDAAPPPADPRFTIGGPDTLVVAHARLEDRPARARFVFREGELVEVQLVQTRPPSDATAENLAYAQGLARRYTALYGARQAYDCGGKGVADVSAYECSWLKGPLAIKLAYLDVAGQAPELTLTYRRAADPNYDL